jgi:hypothetical protein
MGLDEPIEAIVFRAIRDTEHDPVYLKDPDARDARLLSPSFYFRQGIGGYELGLKVRDDLCVNSVNLQCDHEVPRHLQKEYYSRALPEKWLTVFTRDPKIPWAYSEQDESGKMVPKGV